MPIFLAVVRLGQCSICLGQFMLPTEENPYRCPLCGSTMWLYGLRTDRSSAYVRKGISRERKVLNRGVTSAKRQIHGRKQWRQFKPEKPEQNT